MKKTLHLIVVLTVICVAAGLALSLVHEWTRERIAAVDDARRMAAILAVLAPGDAPPVPVPVLDNATGRTNALYVVTYSGNTIAGAALEAMSPNGYAGDIRIMVGFNAFGELHAIDILEHRETPGLGARITSDAYKGGFAGRSLFTTDWRLRKDGGDLDGITAATISSRAVSEAVAGAVARYRRDQDQLLPEPEEPLILENLLHEID